MRVVLVLYRGCRPYNFQSIPPDNKTQKEPNIADTLRQQLMPSTPSNFARLKVDGDYSWKYSYSQHQLMLNGADDVEIKLRLIGFLESE